MFFDVLCFSSHPPSLKYSLHFDAFFRSFSRSDVLNYLFLISFSAPFFCLIFFPSPFFSVLDRLNFSPLFLPEGSSLSSHLVFYLSTVSRVYFLFLLSFFMDPHVPMLPIGGFPFWAFFVTNLRLHPLFSSPQQGISPVYNVLMTGDLSISSMVTVAFLFPISCTRVLCFDK